MLNKLSNSDCIVCSSFHETFGVGLVEAAYFGIPIISSKCEGPVDIVNKINGLLITKMWIHLKILFPKYYKIIKDIIKKLSKNILEKYGEKFILKISLKLLKNYIMNNLSIIILAGGKGKDYCHWPKTS